MAGHIHKLSVILLWLLTSSMFAGQPIRLAREGSFPIVETDSRPAAIFRSFNISESELLNLIVALAPKVNLFRAVWAEDHGAQFYGGTSRDFIYWILGNFRGLSESNEIEKMKTALLQLEVIDIRDIVGRNSDIDVIPTHPHTRFSLKAEDFGVRKIDYISRDILDPSTSLGKNEINQGYIPLEKVILGTRGIQTSVRHESILRELLAGELSIQFPESLEKFWQTHFAKTYSNHPVLLAIRYIRLLAVDYYKRYGTDTPHSKNPIVIPKSIAMQIRSIFQSAQTDPRFVKLLQNPSGLRWLNESFLKSFRSYTNGAAAFMLFKSLGFSELQSLFRDQIESLNQFLFRRIWDPENIKKEWKALDSQEEEYLVSTKVALGTGSLLLHGAGTDESFFGILRYGAIPSENGSAGFGLYSTTEKHKSFAAEWKESGTDRVVKIKIKDSARIFDLRSGPNQKLYQKWLKMNLQDESTTSLDLFCEALGIDILFYHYSVDAAVIKNSFAIESISGLTRNPLTLSTTYALADHLKDAEDLRSLLLSLAFSSLTLSEANLILSRIPILALSKIDFQKAFQDVDLFDLNPALLQSFLAFCKSNKLIPQMNTVIELIGLQFNRADQIFASSESHKKKKQIVEWLNGLTLYEPEEVVIEQAMKIFPKIYSIELTAAIFFKNMSALKWKNRLLLRFLREAGAILAAPKKYPATIAVKGGSISAPTLDQTLSVYAGEIESDMKRFQYVAHIIKLVNRSLTHLSTDIEPDVLNAYLKDFYLPIVQNNDLEYLIRYPFFIDHPIESNHAESPIFKAQEELILHMIALAETSDQVLDIVINSFKDSRSNTGIFFWLSRPSIRNKLFSLFGAIATRKNHLSRKQFIDILTIFLNKSGVKAFFPDQFLAAQSHDHDFEQGLVHFLKLHPHFQYDPGFYLKKIIEDYPQSLSLARAATDILRFKLVSQYKKFKNPADGVLIHFIYEDMKVLLWLEANFQDIKSQNLSREFFAVFFKIEEALYKLFKIRDHFDPEPRELPDALRFQNGYDAYDTLLDIAAGRNYLLSIKEKCDSSLRSLEK